MLNDALNAAENQILERIKAAGQPKAGTPEALQLDEDKRRIIAINSIRTSWGNPGREKTIADSQDAAEQAGKRDVVDTYDQGSGQVRTASAARGLLGSSQTRIAQGKALAVRDQGLKDVVTNANDQATGIRQSDEGSYLQALDQVLSPTSTSGGANAVMTAQNDVNNRAGVLEQQNNSMFHGALSQAIGGFLTNSVGGAAKYGFDRAQTINDANRQNYYDGGMQGPKPKRLTWSLFD